MRALENKISNFTGTDREKTRKISCVRSYFVKFESFEICFLGLP